MTNNNHAIRALVSIDDSIDEATVRSVLPDDAELHVVGFLHSVDETWAGLRQMPSDLLVFACSGYSERVLSLIVGAVHEHPGTPIVVLSEDSPPGFLSRVFELGADDVIPLPEAPERVLFTVQKVIARRRAAASASGTAQAPMICILGPKGGTGKTVTTSNLTAALARDGKRVVAVDLDLQFGDLALCLGVRPERTIFDLAKSGGSLDADKLDAFLVPHPTGARVLVAPTRPDQASIVTVEFLRDVFSVLRATNDIVLVDSSPGFTPEVIAAIDSSTYACMLTMLDTLSLKNTRLGLETLDLMGYEPARIVLVLNRADSRVGISDDDVHEVVGRRPDIRIPSDVAITRSVNDGNPIVLARPGSAAAHSFDKLAEAFTSPTAHVAGDGAPPIKVPKRRLLARRH